MASASRASFCAASTNVRLSAAAVAPVKVPKGRGALIAARAVPVAVTRTTASVSGANGRPRAAAPPVTGELKSDVKLWDGLSGGLLPGCAGPFAGHVHDDLTAGPGAASMRCAADRGARAGKPLLG